jgi:hypothetical protein
VTTAPGGNPMNLDVTYVGGAYAVTGGFHPEEDHAELTMRASGSGGFSAVTFDRTFKLNKYRDPVAVDQTPPDTPTSLAPSSSIRTDADGTRRCYLVYDWAGVAASDLAYYRLKVRVAGGNFVEHQVGGTHYEILAEANTAYEAQLIAVDVAGNVSNTYPTPPAVVSYTTVGDTAAPAAPANLTAVGGFKNALLNWDNASDADLRKVEVWRNTTNNSVGATRITVMEVAASRRGFLIDSNLALATDYYYFLKSVDQSGNTSAFTASAKATTAKIGTTDITPNAITTPLLGAGVVLADNIGAGQIQAQHFDVASGLPGAMLISGFGVSIGDVASTAGSPLSLRAIGPAGNVTITGNRVKQLTDSGSWAEGAYSDQAWTGACTVSGARTTPGRCIVGLATAANAAAANYPTISYGWYVDEADRIYYMESGTFVQLASAYNAHANLQIVYDGKTIQYLSGGQVFRTVPVAAGLIFYAKVLLDQAGTEVSNLMFTSGMDNSLSGADPAARINANSTLIQGGKVAIVGSTPLSSWLYGGDNTLINGGKIGANSIAVNAITIGARGVDIVGVEFTANWNGAGAQTNAIAWTSGTLSYVDDNGTPIALPIAAGATTWGGAGTLYIYWPKGNTSNSLLATTNGAVAYAANNLVMATYRGGADMVVTYGRTIIDGSKITTNTILANVLVAGTISSRELATTVLISQSSQLGNAVVSTLKIAGSSIFQTFNAVGGDVTIPSSGAETVLLTTPVYTIGLGGVNGAATVSVQGIWDGTAQVDASADLYLDISTNGGAYVRVATSTCGVRTGGGSTRTLMPFYQPYAVPAGTTMQARLVGKAVLMTGSSSLQTSAVRQPKISVGSGFR